MLNKILIINSSADKNRLLKRACEELELKNFYFHFWSSQKSLPDGFGKNQRPDKIIFLGPELKNKNIPFFIILLPFLQLRMLIALAGPRIKHQVDSVVCLNFNEKIIATAPARLLGLKIVWLESPDINYRKTNKFLLWLYKANSRLAKLAVFNNFAKLQLTGLGFKEGRITLLPPGTKSAHYQENIFNKLAAHGQANFHRKYFTVGAITALNQKQKIEAIFQAIKISLPLIPNLQLIIVGEGEERKNLSWLAKKMEIENLVWLVGEQEQLKKWLDSFDIFLAAGDSLKLDDYGNILDAMASELPVLAPRNIGLEDLVLENKTGALVEAENSEMLARQIIKLHQDKRLRTQLGKNGSDRVNQLFTLEVMAEKLENLLKNN